MKTFTVEIREDVLGVLLAVIDRVQISGKEADAIVLAKQTLQSALLPKPPKEKPKK